MKKLFQSLYLFTLLGMILGVGVGAFYGKSAACLGNIAKQVIWVIKTAAIPLLFLAILDAILRNEWKGKAFVRLLFICAINSVFAVCIALSLTNFFVPGKYFGLPQISPDSAKKVVSMATASKGETIALFFSSPMILGILGSLFIGVLLIFLEHQLKWFPLIQGIKRLREKVQWMLDRWIVLMEWLVVMVPFAVFGAVAKVVGEYGFTLAKGLSIYFLTCIAGMILHVILVYHAWILGWAGIPLRRFWKAAKEPVIHAFGINSSLATLPMTLKALERLKISSGSARLSACVGTNFNNDGILLYEVVAVLFMAQVYGVELSLGQQVSTAFICVVATIGVGGIPEAGIISLALVLNAVHLPLEGITLLLTVDWVIARLRSATNVLGDLTVAIVLDGRR